MCKFLAFKLEVLEADNTKLVEYGNSFAFMMGAIEKLSAKVNKKSRVLNIKFKAVKGTDRNCSKKQYIYKSWLQVCRIFEEQICYSS